MANRLTWYRAYHFGSSSTLTTVEILRHTDASVWIPTYSGKIPKSPDRRETSYSLYTPTWKEAHDWLVKKCEEEVRGSARRIEQAKSGHDILKKVLADVTAMKDPTNG